MSKSLLIVGVVSVALAFANMDDELDLSVDAARRHGLDDYVPKQYNAAEVHELTEEVDQLNHQAQKLVLNAQRLEDASFVDVNERRKVLFDSVKYLRSLDFKGEHACHYVERDLERWNKEAQKLRDRIHLDQTLVDAPERGKHRVQHSRMIELNQKRLEEKEVEVKKTRHLNDLCKKLSWLVHEDLEVRINRLQAEMDLGRNRGDL